MIKKYVQGGLCDQGDGSRHKPYNSLILAQNDLIWSTLIVLSSPIPLVDGITLRHGTKLIGEDNDNLPILSKNGVICNGISHIENIYFKDTIGSSINYDNATNITIKNVIITGHNKDLLLNQPDSELAGIHGKTTG